LVSSKPLPCAYRQKQAEGLVGTILPALQVIERFRRKKVEFICNDNNRELAHLPGK
jgi:translation initiation factor IF-1